MIYALSTEILLTSRSTHRKLTIISEAPFITFGWSTKSFVELPDSAISQINKGLRIARKQLAPDMLTLPVHAAE